MKKILIFSLAYYPHVGGAEVALKEITDRIKDIEFHMVTLRFSSADAPRERVGNVVVHRVGRGASFLSKLFFIPRAGRAAIQLHKKEKFDAVWVMMLYMLFPLWVMRLRVKLPYALTIQEGDPYERVFERWHIRMAGGILKTGLRNATVVQVISNYLAGWATRNHYAGPLEVIPNGVDLERFAQPKQGNTVRKALTIRENETLLVTSSRLVHKNAVDTVLRALPQLPAVHFLVAGSGPQEKNLKNLARELGVARRVYFAGYVSHQALPAYLQASDVFIRPSRSEGMGNSFIEAMAAGLPVIATQEGGIADFLFDARKNPDKPPTGFAVEKDNPGQIAQAVERIMSNSQATKGVIENARRLVFEHYSWDTIAQGMRERVFARVL